MRRVLVLLALCASSPAFADNPKAAAAAREGQQRYQAGKYLDAAEKFEQAYAIDPDPAYLFNLAQSYRLGNACAKSAAAYRKLLATVSSGPNMDKVPIYIQQMDACAKGQEPAKPEPVVESPPVVEQPPTHEPLPPPPDRSGSPALRYAGIGAGVVGIAAVAFGAFNIKKVGDAESAREKLCADGCIWEDVRDDAAALDDDGKRYQLRARISFIAGGIAIAGGLTMFILGRDRGEEGPPRMSVIPVEGGAMALTSLRF